MMGEFVNTGSTIRCLITSIAFGMGVNIPDIHVDMIYHWVEPDSVLQYWQHVGRAGCDGRHAKVKHIQNNNTNCLRQYVLQHVHLPEMGTLPVHHLPVSPSKIVLKAYALPVHVVVVAAKDVNAVII